MDWLTRDQKFHLDLAIDELDSETLNLLYDDGAEEDDEADLSLS